MSEKIIVFNKTIFSIIGSTDVAASSFGRFFTEPPGPIDGPSCTYKGETYPNGVHVYKDGSCKKYYCNYGEIELYLTDDCDIFYLYEQDIEVSMCTKIYTEGVCCPRYDCPPEAYRGRERPEEYSSSSSPSEEYSSEAPEEYSSEAPEEYSSSPPTPDSSSKTLKCVTVQ
ncbi:CLUMA_CG021433, isoform A [Clunio marinus]|uniref:CLUMA_CG021433, isoform A n=1 Tax=Clunio marinus TaxID=568069 RepID=A0A1J1J8X9_9DIPT|nr:CLUMA_CG021433, isoform A [Clunio marinus]